MAGVLTTIDKSLLLRAARLLVLKAEAIEKAHDGLWVGHRPAKQQHDALLRDARDIRALVARLGIAAPVAIHVTENPDRAGVVGLVIHPAPAGGVGGSGQADG